MNIKDFIEKRPYLYHLTNENNLPLIIKHKRLYSANALIDLSNNTEYQPLKRTKRGTHSSITIDGEVYSIRDQQPISEKALSKCLTDNWSCADYYEHLNFRVFMWPTLERLWRHFNRYAAENPVILSFETEAIFKANPHVKFSRLNSGATRANSYLGGIPPLRGLNTFQIASDFNYSVGSVAEVTFENECLLNGKVEKGKSPEGEYSEVAVFKV